MVEAARDLFECNPEKFVDLLDDAEHPLYTGCSRFTKLYVLVRLYNFKTKYGWSDASFNELLSFWGDVLPKGNLMPTSIYEAKKTLCALGMQYEKIHACPNDCICIEMKTRMLMYVQIVLNQDGKFLKDPIIQK